MGNNSVRGQVCCGSDRKNLLPASVKASARKTDPRPSDEQAVHEPPLEPERKIVEEIDRLSLIIQSPCRKYPQTPGSFMSGRSRDRFIAAIPAADTEDIPGEGWARWLTRWRRGRLAYWQDRHAYHRQLPPKGEIDLVSITKIHWEREQPEDITVKYLAVREANKLVLQFADRQKAEQWREALRSLRNLL
mmetsp:Transcript_739/g.1983  ORF Transcript_739/g.1983 Transcript_739/m.1983 type:complete len:190 (-) Transcript_739:90-659(-)